MAATANATARAMGDTFKARVRADFDDFDDFDGCGGFGGCGSFDGFDCKKGLPSRVREEVAVVMAIVLRVRLLVDFRAPATCVGKSTKGENPFTD
jgi:hypothetical protein